MPSVKRPTQADVASLAGVSQAVVSYVLNNTTKAVISPETRDRVLLAIEELGYVPNSAARSLRSKRTSTIAVIIPDIANPFYPEFVRGVQDVATAAALDVLAVNTDGDPVLERNALDAARRGRVDGMILVAFWTPLDEIESIVRGGTPVAMLSELDVSNFDQSLPIDCLAISGEEAGAAVVSWLIERGHRHIGMIAGLASTRTRESRVQGYRRALMEHHVPLNETLIRGGDFTEHGGYEAMRELLSMPHRPTAVFAANDLMALGAYLACREQGVRIPDDLAIAGFDNIPAAKLVFPALTTLDQRAKELGQKAATKLLARLSGTHTGPPTYELCDFDLIIRDSA